ncbi:DUF2127 domain-containing protein [Methanolobus sp.]|uniref:DUF2127 domain-containing protein n=1 Tax=Methanolobus sp. TaxID=1874737 RepID=UPI0025EA69D2|nr:DUF2127 domain-containing protein [Methanolobus sp.]
MLKNRKENIIHDIFIIGIIIKGIDGLLELIGGFILISSKSDTISKIIQTIFKHEIAQDPTDLLANYFIQLSNNLSISTISFAAIYLIIHGSIKIGLFSGLWYKKLWTYPLAGILLSFFVMYQLIRFFNTHSILLLFLTLVDILIIILLRFEYKRLKHSAL